MTTFATSLLHPHARHRFIAFAIPIAFMALLAGCAGQTEQNATSQAKQKLQRTSDRRLVQSDLMNLVDDLITSVADVYGEIASKSNHSDAAGHAEVQRLEIASGALDNAVNPNPLAGLMDTVVLVVLAADASDNDATRQLLGPTYASVIKMLRDQEASAWNVAARHLSNDQLTELRRAIKQWRAQNPEQRYVSHVRLVDFLITRPIGESSTARPDSIFQLLFLDPLAGIDPAVRELSQSRETAERMFFYTQRMSLILTWRAEALYRQMLAAPQVARTLDEVGKFNQTAEQFTKTTMELTTSLSKLPTDTIAIIDHSAKAYAVTSDSAIKATAEHLASERAAAIDQLAKRAHIEHEAIANSFEAATNRSIERLQWTLQVVLMTFLAGTFILLIVYRLLISRARRLIQQEPRTPRCDSSSVGV